MKTYNEWNAERQQVFGTLDPSYNQIEVVHGEYETALYFGNTGGLVVAIWSTATGECSISTVAEAADRIADASRNYINNAAADGVLARRINAVVARSTSEVSKIEE